MIEDDTGRYDDINYPSQSQNITVGGFLDSPIQSDPLRRESKEIAKEGKRLILPLNLRAGVHVTALMLHHEGMCLCMCCFVFLFVVFVCVCVFGQTVLSICFSVCLKKNKVWQRNTSRKRQAT